MMCVPCGADRHNYTHHDVHTRAVKLWTGTVDQHSMDATVPHTTVTVNTSSMNERMNKTRDVGVVGTLRSQLDLK